MELREPPAQSAVRPNKPKSSASFRNISADFRQGVDRSAWASKNINSRSDSFVIFPETRKPESESDSSLNFKSSLEAVETGFPIWTAPETSVIDNRSAKLRLPHDWREGMCVLPQPATARPENWKMFNTIRTTVNLMQGFRISTPAHSTKLDRNDYAYYDNSPPEYNGSIGPQGDFDFDYFGYGLAPSGTVPNGTLEHPW